MQERVQHQINAEGIEWLKQEIERIRDERELEKPLAVVYNFPVSRAVWRPVKSYEGVRE